MPDPQRKLPRGQGTFDPEFTSRVEPIREQEVARVQESQFERFEKAMISIGSGIVGGLQSLAAQQAGLARLKDQAVARQDKIISQVRAGQAAGQRSMQERRLNDIRTSQQKLLIEAPDHNPEWLFRQVRSSFNNAASVEEQAMWSELLIGSRKVADQFKVSEEKEQDNEIIQQFAMAGQTAQQAVAEMVSTLQQDDDLQRELMGNGVGIHQRVQDWILTEAAMAAPDIFDIRAGDTDRELKLEQRDQLIAALVENSLPVGDQLIQQHEGQLDASAFQTGSDLLGASLLSYFNGKLGIKSVADSITSIGQLHFNHLTDVEQKQKFKQFLADAIDAATSGQFGNDVGDIEQKVGALISAGPYNDFEKANLNDAATARLLGMATKNYQTEVQRATLSRTIEMPKVGGSTLQTISVPDPNAAITLSIPDDLGISEYDRIADQVIIDGRLDIPVDQMTPMQVAAVSQIRETAAALNLQGQESLISKVGAQDNIRRVANGDIGGDPAKAYQNGIIMAAFSDAVAMTPAQAREIAQRFESVQQSNLTTFGTEIVDVSTVWDGHSKIPMTDKTRGLRQAVYQLAAEQVWDTSESRSTKLPDNLVTSMVQKWTAGNTEAMIDTVYFVSALSEARQNDVYDKMDPKSAEALALRSAIHNQKKTANNFEFAMAPEELVDKARQRIATGDPNAFLDRMSSFPEYSGEINRAVGTAAIAEILYINGLPTNTDSDFFGLGHAPASTNEERMFDIQQVFLDTTDEGVNNMLRLWAMRVGETNDSAEDAAQWVFGNLQASGMRIVDLGEGSGMKLVEDPQLHFPSTTGGFGNPHFVGVRKEVQQIRDFPDKIAAYVDSPLLPWQRTVMQLALGLSPKDAPITIHDMYSKLDTVNPLFVQDSRGGDSTSGGPTTGEQATQLVAATIGIPKAISDFVFPAGTPQRLRLKFVMSDPRQQTSQATLRKDAQQFGGIILQPIAIDGRPLPVARAKFDVDWTDPDGVRHTIQKGEPLSVFSNQLFNSVVPPTRVGSFTGLPGLMITP